MYSPLFLITFMEVILFNVIVYFTGNRVLIKLYLNFKFPRLLRFFMSLVWFHSDKVKKMTT